MGCRLDAAGDLVDVHELQIGTAPSGAERKPPHAAEAIDADAHRHTGNPERTARDAATSSRQTYQAIQGVTTR
jgi:hypothetical protein